LPQLIGMVKFLPFTGKSCYSCAVLPRKEMVREDYDSEAREIFVNFQRKTTILLGQNSKVFSFPSRRRHGADFCACRFNGSVASGRCNLTLKSSELGNFTLIQELHIKQYPRSEWFPVKLVSYKRRKKEFQVLRQNPEHSTETRSRS